MFSPDVPRNVRTLFLSDLHLGFRLSMGGNCLRVLDYFSAQVIYLVGDTIDVTRMSRVWHWSDAHQAIVDRIVALHQAGHQLRLLPGNHDPCFARDERFIDKFGTRTAFRLQQIIEPLLRLPMQESFVHESVTGRKLLVLHGDQVDRLNEKWLGIPKLGSKIFDYVSVILPNRATLELRNFFKLILTRPSKIEALAIESARQKKLDGLIMGHLHQPLLRREQDGLIVVNTGDWVENSTVVLETTSGEFLLINHGEIVDRIMP